MPRALTDDLAEHQRGQRACFKKRPVRGPGLQGFRILAVSRRPRALTRRPPTILKHALTAVPQDARWLNGFFAGLFSRAAPSRRPRRLPLSRQKPLHPLTILFGSQPDNAEP